MIKIRKILVILILFATYKVFAQSNNATFQDTTTVKGRIVTYETKKASTSLVVFYKIFDLELNTRLSEVKIDDSLFVACVNTDRNGDFKLELPKGDYVMKISSPLSLDITQKVSFKNSVEDVGIYDLFSPCYYLDEAPAMSALRRRVYNRIMMIRKNKNPTKFNFVDDDEIENDSTKLSVVYNDFNSDSDIKAYYTSGFIVYKEDLNNNRQNSKKRMLKYMKKMDEKYSKLEDLHFQEALINETL